MCPPKIAKKGIDRLSDKNFTISPAHCLFAGDAATDQELQVLNLAKNARIVDLLNLPEAATGA